MLELPEITNNLLVKMANDLFIILHRNFKQFQQDFNDFS